MNPLIKKNHRTIIRSCDGFYHIKRIRLLLLPENQHLLHKLVDKLQIPERLQYRIYLHHATGNVVVLDLFKALCHITQIIKAVRTENKFRTCFLNGLLEIFLVDPLFARHSIIT